tara:strand:- start:34954 stop:35169 length:216 start_codon:yes stop_codon:yes gene_type:complete
MRIDIEDILKLIEAKRKLNSLDLKEIEFYENNKKVEIPEQIIKDWNFTGLSNIDFIDTDFYKHGFDSPVKD